MQVEEIAGESSFLEAARTFDERLRRTWLLAEVGFVVFVDGTIYSPALTGKPPGREFRLENERFLSNRESVEAYWNTSKGQALQQPVDEKKQSGDKSTSDTPK